MLLEAEESQLVLVDYQQRLMPALHEGAFALANAVRLARVARLMQVPIWGVELNAAKLGATEPQLREWMDTVVPKMTFGSGEQLVPRLRPPVRQQAGNARSLPKHLRKPEPAPDAGRSTIVLAGCETHVCLLQTALELLEEEFDVCVVTDACASRTERNRDAAFDRLAGAGCELVTTEMVAFEWLRTAEHPLFREVLAIIK
jgi:nicotinamidase-related amidase